MVFCAPVDMRPSDIGLHGILEMNPRWEQYAISLGLTIEQTKYYLEQQQEALRGLLALKHWRDGRSGSSYPGTWKFLLDVIKDRLGPVVADKLRDKITANEPWTITGRIGRCSSPFMVASCVSGNVCQRSRISGNIDNNL